MENSSSELGKLAAAVQEQVWQGQSKNVPKKMGLPVEAHVFKEQPHPCLRSYRYHP